MPAPNREKLQEIVNNIVALAYELMPRGVIDIVDNAMDLARWYKRNGWMKEYEDTVRFLSTPNRLIEGWVKSRDEVVRLIDGGM